MLQGAIIVPYRLLALDLDGTLLDDDKTISEPNRKAIQAAQDQGVMVTFSTGRMYCSALRFARELKMNVPLITYNGALIKDTAGKVYQETSLSLPAARTALAIAGEYNIHVNLFIRDELFVDRDDEWTERYRRSSSVMPQIVPNLEQVLAPGVNKVLLIGDEQELIPVRDILGNKLADLAHITSSNPQFIEIVHPDVSKQSGLSYLLEVFDMSPEKVIAIGDNYNDLEMINFAGLGVAMANAPEDIRAQADYVTGYNNEAGVAQVINKFILS